MNLSRWAIDEIVIVDRMRGTLREETVNGLMKSIREIGLQELPTVRIGHDEEQDGGEYPILITGRHRIEALKRLGERFVDCIEFDGDEIKARLWEISENLDRAELTPDERDEHIQEWFRLTGKGKSDESQAGDDKMHGAVHFRENARVGAGRGNKGGVRDFSRDHNIPEQTVRDALDLGKFDPTVRQKADAAGLNRKEKLRVVRTAGGDTVQQAALIREIAEEKTSKAEAHMFAEWLMERMKPKEKPLVISWLEGCKPKDVIAAMRPKAA